ncbi:MAG: choice-of-anchor B family protein [Bacteroidota bacterium]|nr:choice-of-anchor B family protein [Bacteroidota bacterium]
MKKLLFILTTTFILANTQAQQTATLLYHWQDTTLVDSGTPHYNTYNECWGVVVNEREFAIIGSTAGTHFFDVTDPANSSQVAFVAGAYTGVGVIHRDYHDFEGYLYAVCDEGNTSTLQIIDISNLPNSVNTVYDSNALITKSHNIYIDTTSAKMYSCGTNGTMQVYSLNSPQNPILIYSYNTYVHDAYIINDIAYLNCGGNGLIIEDFTMVDTIGDQPTLLGSLTSYHDAGYNHSGWLNENKTIYAMFDENHGYDVKILDVSDLNNISVLSIFNSGVDSQSMAHNGIIKGDLLFISYYHDGLRVFDISDPYNPIQSWQYDTYSSTNYAGYRGAWGVYPNLPSGNIIVSDMQTGLYLFQCGTPTGMIENKLKTKIFPNPATSQFTLVNTQAESMILYNTLGVKVKEQKLNVNQNMIYKGNLANGLYFYSLNKDGKNINSGKVIFR